MLKIRKFFLDSITDFYKTSFGEKDVPHLFAILLFSLFDYLLIYGVSTWLNFIVEKSFVIILIILLPTFNFTVYRKIKEPKRISMIWFWIYGGIALIAFISSMFYSRYLFLNGG